MTDRHQSHRNVHAIKCDVTSWEDQSTLFESAINFSPTGTIDIVIANAGLGALGDPLVVQPDDDPSGPAATKPDLRINPRGEPAGHTLHDAAGAAPPRAAPGQRHRCWGPLAHTREQHVCLCRLGEVAAVPRLQGGRADADEVPEEDDVEGGDSC